MLLELYSIFAGVMARILFIFAMMVCMACAVSHSYAQAVPDTSLNNIISEDSVNKAQDTVFKSPTAVQDSTPPVTPVYGPFQPNPKKAGLYSALVPGMGQLYNRQYWKMPLIYAAIGVTAYVFFDNLNNYQSFRKAYIGRINNPYPTDQYVNIYSTDQLNQLQNDYNRYVDLTVLVGVLEYTVQVIDAITSAHLKNFDISRDISMRVQPVATPAGLGFGMVLRLKPRTPFSPD